MPLTHVLKSSRMRAMHIEKTISGMGIPAIDPEGVVDSRGGVHSKQRVVIEVLSNRVRKRVGVRNISMELMEKVAKESTRWEMLESEKPASLSFRSQASSPSWLS